MEVDVYNMQGQKVSKVELPAVIFEAPVNMDLMHQAHVRQMANARLGTHQTKTRGDVAGGGRKPWKQKGTGRARQGSTRAPHWKGGGGAHTPHPHGYTLAMPVKMRRAALRSALTVKAQEAGIVVVDELALPEAKTRLMVQALTALVGEKSALVLIPEKTPATEMVMRSTNNIPDAKTLMASFLNIRDVMVYDTIVMPLQAIDKLAAFLG
ncbi:MAG TPA: 50S ribosomal protein L4 [Anaerolineaceae bacterium]|nr:50S ribosomal protein L4 [Anaerolineaceae bacterium]HPN53716.1 50S ribosomal protein L4 [Anaerolineaceae bacterium]